MEDKTEIYKGIVGSLVRAGLGGVAAWLAQKGILTSDQTQFLLTEATAIVFAGVLVAWVWIKNHATAKLQDKQIQIALQADTFTPVATVKAKAKAEVDS